MLTNFEKRCFILIETTGDLTEDAATLFFQSIILTGAVWNLPDRYMKMTIRILHELEVEEYKHEGTVQ